MQKLTCERCGREAEVLTRSVLDHKFLCPRCLEKDLAVEAQMERSWCDGGRDFEVLSVQ